MHQFQEPDHHWNELNFEVPKTRAKPSTVYCKRWVIASAVAENSCTTSALSIRSSVVKTKKVRSFLQQLQGHNSHPSSNIIMLSMTLYKYCPHHIPPCLHWSWEHNPAETVVGLSPTSSEVCLQIRADVIFVFLQFDFWLTKSFERLFSLSWPVLDIAT